MIAQPTKVPDLVVEMLQDIHDRHAGGCFSSAYQITLMLLLVKSA